MPGRKVSLATDEFYHLYNRGVEKRDIFVQPRDYQRFRQTFFYYQFVGPKPKFSYTTKGNLRIFKPLSINKLVEIICYCLMPNHFHFLVRQLLDNGISNFISQISNSYTKYFNTKYERNGGLFQGTFKATRIETDEQLIHTSRYIHLNPLVSGVTKYLENYHWSSYPEYFSNNEITCNPKEVLSFFRNPKKYKEFVNDQIDYAKSLEKIKHLTFEN